MIETVEHQGRFAQAGWVVFVIGEVWFGYGCPDFRTGGWSSHSQALLIYTKDFKEITDVPGYIRQDLVDINDFWKAKATNWIEID